MDYSQDQFFLNSPSLFADEGHLNNDGAKKFSEIIAKVLEESQDL
jgi:lysophospholipase L1-like esterase